MTVEPVFFWNLLLTLVIAPAVFIFRALQQEVKRIDILLNKTREDYAKRDDVTQAINRLEEKIDRILEKLK
jgi:hypothetical protein|tara:strand:- start:696 stop:908 length:213 start_codon:yes stop_codon:yes gene_type:complete